MLVRQTHTFHCRYSCSYWVVPSTAVAYSNCLRSRNNQNIYWSVLIHSFVGHIWNKTSRSIFVSCGCWNTDGTATSLQQDFVGIYDAQFLTFPINFLSILFTDAILWRGGIHYQLWLIGYFSQTKPLSDFSIKYPPRDRCRVYITCHGTADMWKPYLMYRCIAVDMSDFSKYSWSMFTVCI